uniref:Uncharacterized protein n=1 Tax=Rhizophora mucronata TaxID=61149 RepID=A0A2P2NS61_RHIMU
MFYFVPLYACLCLFNVEYFQ